MSQPEILKPCPFCASKDVELRVSITDEMIACNNCGCRTGFVYLGANDASNAAKRRELIEVWNTRTPEAATTIAKLVEAVTDAREALALGAVVPFVDSRCSVEVTALCDTFGYGAVMSTASALWRELLKADGIDGGEFCAGPCRATAQAAIAKIDTALSLTGEIDRG